MLAAVQSTAIYTKHDHEPESAPAPQSHWAYNQLPSPHQLGHYSPIWKDCLEAAKEECRASHALTNPWLKMQVDLGNSIMDSLTMVVMDWNRHSVHFEPDMYLCHSSCCLTSPQDIGPIRSCIW